MSFRNVQRKETDMKKVYPVENHAESYLPGGTKWKLVWNDEFDGSVLDESKWNFRLTFWGERSPTFTDEGVNLDGDSHMKIELIRDGDSFRSAHLQTGSLTFDMPEDKNNTSIWPFGKNLPMKFMHKFGYYEIRCRLPKHPGWHAAFWLQSPCIGAHPDPAVAGVECDIMENYRQHTDGEIICGCGWGGYGEDSRWYGHFAFPYEETNDGWHYYGVHWRPDGYIFYADGMEVGRSMAPECAVSHIEQFLLVSTECHGYRRRFTGAGGAGDTKFAGEPVPELYDAYPDCFEVDFVRVFDEV